MPQIWPNQGPGNGLQTSMGRTAAARVKPRRLPGAAKIRARELPVFTRMVAAMLEAGIPLVQTLTALEEQTSSRVFRSVIAGLRARIEAGTDFSAALQEYPDIFDDLYVSMMRAGEAGGMLAEIAGRTARHLESAARMRRKVRAAMIYPIVVLTIAITIATAMVIWLIPVFSDIYEEFEGQLPLPTRLLIALSGFLRQYFLYVLGALILLGLAFRQWKRTESGRKMVDGWLLQLPVIGVIARKVCMARFSSTFAQLIHSGVPILETLDIVSVAVGNRVLGALLQGARATVERGELLSVELQRHRVFPRMLVYMLSAGEKTGKMDEMLERVADFYEDEVKTALSGLTAAIEPVLMVFLGAIVGSIVLSMFMPIFRMTDILKF